MKPTTFGAPAPTIPNNPDVRMSSVEIAELMDKRHDHVLRDIKKLIEQQTINGPNFGVVEYKDAKGEMRPMYLLDFQPTMVLITGYDAKRRAVVIGRRLKLERGEARPAMDDPKTAMGPEVDLDLTREGELMLREVKPGMRLAKSMGLRNQVMFDRTWEIVRQRTGVDFMDYFGLRPDDLGATKAISLTAGRGPGSPTKDLPTLIDEFLETCCRGDVDKRVQAGVLYDHFVAYLSKITTKNGKRFRSSKNILRHGNPSQLRRHQIERHDLLPRPHPGRSGKGGVGMNAPKLKILQADATPEEASAHLRANRVKHELERLNEVSYSIKGIGIILDTITEHEGYDNTDFPLAHNGFVKESLYKTLNILGDQIDHTATTLQGLLNH